MKTNRDYTSYSFFISILVIGILIGISQIRGFHIGQVYIKPVNILSDVWERDDHTPAPLEATLLDDQLLAEIEALEAEQQQANAAESVLPPNTDAAQDVLNSQWNLGTDSASGRRTRIDPSGYVTGDAVPIEDYGTDGNAMAHFYAALQDTMRTRPVRIAVLGDSFIEGDIFTADLREQLQDLYGGGGVGFVSFATTFNKFRGSVNHNYNNWRILTFKDRGGLGDDMRSKFFVSGVLNLPSEGATTKLEGNSFRKHLKQAGTAKLLFINREHTQIDVVVNDSASNTFRPEPSEYIQQITIQAPVSSIRVKLSQTSGFIGYGIILEDNHGISVDNFSIRGNSGLSLYEANRSVNAQISHLVGYDLIILQYGLNVMSADVMKYTLYGEKFGRLIEHIRQSFPGASILVMGVGDRSTQRDGQFVSMPSIPGMLKAQRDAAETAGVAFWNTFEAMGGPNSMATFVKNKWAAADYTHIRHGGGKYIAEQLIKSFFAGMEGERQAQIRREIEQLESLIPEYQLDLNPAHEAEMENQGTEIESHTETPEEPLARPTREVPTAVEPKVETEEETAPEENLSGETGQPHGTAGNISEEPFENAEENTENKETETPTE